MLSDKKPEFYLSASKRKRSLRPLPLLFQTRELGVISAPSLYQNTSKTQQSVSLKGL